MARYIDSTPNDTINVIDRLNEEIKSACILADCAKSVSDTAIALSCSSLAISIVALIMVIVGAR